MQIIAAAVALLIYLAVLLLIGIYTKKWVSDASDYMLAGREFGVAANVIELCAIALAGSLMTFLPSLVIQYGLRTALIRYVLILGLGYAVYGVLYGKLARDSGAQSVAEYLELRFDFKVRTLVAVISSFAMLGISANNVLAITNVINRMIGIPQIIIASICFFIIILFSVMGGFWGITLTDMIQLIIGGSAIFALLVYLTSHFGGWSFLVTHFPSVNLWTTGTNGESMRFFSARYPSGLTMILNFMVFLLWGNNYYFLRLNTCRNGRVARSSYMITGLVCIPVLLAPVTLLGAYAAAIYPERFWGRHVVDGASALSLLIDNAPMLLKIFMLIGFLAITVSTASTALIGVTSTVSRDIWKRRFRPDMTKEEELKVQKRLMFFVALIGWALCFYSGGTIRMFGFVTSWLGPVAVLVLMAALCPRFTSKGALYGSAAGVLLLTASSIMNMMGVHNSLVCIHSSILGIISTLVVGTVISLFTKSNYYGQRKWRRIPEEGGRNQVILSNFDRSVLEMIRYGTITMAEITDYIGCDSRMSKMAVETLDKGGYIIRKGIRFSNFFHFEITRLGRSVLKELPESEKRLAEAGLSREQFEFLVCAESSREELQRYISQQGYGSLKTTAVISLLDHRGYVRQRGMMKRQVIVTKSGHEIIDKYSNLLTR